MGIKIHEVTSLNVSVLEMFPPKLSISATGKVLSFGWHDAKLIPKSHKNGIYEYYFVALIPIDHPVPGDYEIEANLVIEYPTDLKKIIIHSQTNSKEIEINNNENQKVLDSKRNKRTAKGISTNYSFDEAFSNAITNLPPDNDTTIDKLTIIIVKQIGAEKGGIVGLNQMFVLVEAN